MTVVVNPQIVVLYDANGVAHAVQNGVAIPVNTPAILIAGNDGAAARYMRTAADGTVRTDPTGTTTQPVSAAALPLPAGAATEATLATRASDTGLAAVYARQADGSQLTGVNNAAGAGAVNIQDGGNSITVDGPVTDAELRATPVPVSGTVTAIPSSNKTTIHNAATIVASGSEVITGLGMAEWHLLINLKSAPTGVTPTIAFKIEAVDPVDQSTVMDSSRTIIGVTHSGIGTEILRLGNLSSDTVKISWTVSGAGPSFTNVNVTWVGIVAGDEPGYTSGARSAYRVFGGGTANANLPIVTTAYSEPSSAAQRSIASSSASDTAAGIGARMVKITYYDDVLNGPFTETVTLNGVTPVNTTATNIRFIESLVVVNVGSDGANVGTITLYTGLAGAGTVITTISVNSFNTGFGDNQTFACRHYVAAGKTCRITSISSNSSGQAVIIARTKYPLDVDNPGDSLYTYALNGQSNHTFGDGPLILVGPARLVLNVIPAANNVTVNAAFAFRDS